MQFSNDGKQVRDNDLRPELHKQKAEVSKKSSVTKASKTAARKNLFNDTHAEKRVMEFSDSDDDCIPLTELALNKGESITCQSTCDLDK